jgi:hypothetical protein
MGRGSNGLMNWSIILENFGEFWRTDAYLLSEIPAMKASTTNQINAR